MYFGPLRLSSHVHRIYILYRSNYQVAPSESMNWTSRIIESRPLASVAKLASTTNQSNFILSNAWCLFFDMGNCSSFLSLTTKFMFGATYFAAMTTSKRMKASIKGKISFTKSMSSQRVPSRSGFPFLFIAITAVTAHIRVLITCLVSPIPVFFQIY